MNVATEVDLPALAAAATTTHDLAGALRALHRRHAAARGGRRLTYREIAAATGWSHGIVGEYLTGRVLPTTDRFDTLVLLLEARPEEQRALATARDRLEDEQRWAQRGPGVPPRRLPAGPARVVGRAAETAALDALLAAPDRDTSKLALVVGPAGVGKSALALDWARAVAHHFPDGQLFVDLHGFHHEAPPLSPADALVSLLDALGSPASQVPEDLAARTALYRRRLAGARVLVVLDNALDADQVRPLLPASPGCLVVVTSRVQHVGLVTHDGAVPVPLRVLDRAAARELLVDRLGPERLERDPAGTAAVLDACGGLALALAVVAARAAMTPAGELSLAGLAPVVTATGPVGDPRSDIGSVLSWSTTHLTPDAQRLFRRLGQHPGGHLSLREAAALAGVTPAQARPLLVQLGDASLVDPRGRDLWSMHDLVRSYAAALAEALDSPAVRRSARRRQTAQLAWSAWAATGYLDPFGDRLRPDVTSRSVDPEPFASEAEALSWYAAHADQLRAALRSAALHSAALHSAEPDLVRASLSCNVGQYLYWAGQHLAAAEILLEPVPLLSARGEHRMAAANRRRAAYALFRTGDRGRAFRTQEEALHEAREAGELTALARLQMNEGMLRAFDGDPARAEEAFTSAIATASRAGDAVDVARAQNMLAYSLIEAGRADAAEPLITAAVATLERLAAPALDTALDTMGMLHLAQGHAEEAARFFERALAATTDPSYREPVWHHLAEALDLTGDDQAAAAARDQAAAEVERLGGTAGRAR